MCTFDIKKDYNNISKKACAILTRLYLDYVADRNEKEEINKMLYENSKKADRDSKQKYNPNEIFKNKTKTREKEETSLAQVKIEKWYEKIFSFLRNIFKR